MYNMWNSNPTPLSKKEKSKQKNQQLFTTQLVIDINQYAVVFITRYYFQLTFIETYLKFHYTNQNKLHVS